MRRYLKLYWSLVKYNVTRDLQFRSDFWLAVFSRVVWFVVILFFFQIIYRHTATINGWTYYQVLLLVAVFELLETTLYTFLITNFARMPIYVNDGELDFFLLKPVDAQFLVSLHYFSLASALNLLPPLVLLVIAWQKLALAVSFSQIVIFFLLFVSSLLILYALWFLTVIILFWTAKIYEIHELFLSLFRFMQYPSSIYQGALRQFFSLVFPILLTVSLPAQVLLGNLEQPQNLIWLPLLAGVFFGVARWVWKRGLRRYSSASS